MKILHFNTNDFKGGAAKGTYRLHRSLLNKGLDSKLYVQLKELNEHSVYCKSQPYDKLVKQVKPFFERSLLSLLFTPLPNEQFSPSFFATDNLVKISQNFQPDIIHLNWVCGTFLNTMKLKKIRVPVVWTMHDSWVFTGGCHLPYECTRFTGQCGHCPKLKANSEIDISNRLLKQKSKAWNNLDITFVAPSTWLYNYAKNSALLSNRKVIHLPNGIDTVFFQPIEKHIAQGILGLNPKKKYILFGAVNSSSDPNKGYDYLLTSLQKLRSIQNDKIELLILGTGDPGMKRMNIEFPLHYYGNIHDEISMKVLYSAADLTVVPSLSENLSYMIMESMSMGIPVAAFDVGGNSDMIEHRVNGFLATSKNSDELASGIQFLLEFDKTNELKQAARKKIVSNFDIDIIANRYLDLYKSLV